MTCMDAALVVLHDTENPAVMADDRVLLDMIHLRWRPGGSGVHPLNRHKLVLDALGAAVKRGDDRLVKKMTRGRYGIVRVYRIPED